MSMLKKLIDELCPEGVEDKSLGEIGSFYGGLTGKSKKDFGNGNAKFITYGNVYSNPALTLNITDTVNVAEGEKQNKIQYGDILFTGSSETPDECGMSSVVTHEVDEDYYLNSFCFGFRLYDSNQFLPDFLKHYLRCHEVRRAITKTASGVTRYNVSKAKFSKIEIPIPPLSVQQEIVRILDSFTALEAELETKLEAELNCRKRQYEYYRDELFNFTTDNKDVKWMKMSDIGTFTRGKRFVRTDIVDDGVPCIHYGDMYTYYGLKADKAKTHLTPEKAEKMRFAKKNDVVIVGAGENKMDIGVGVAWLGEEDVAVHDACYIFRSDLDPEYVSHYLRTSGYHQQIYPLVSEGKICSISAQSIGRSIIPIPPIEEQRRIASILNRYEALTTDLQSSLPAEIAARRKQYEYYREKLLTFKRKTA